MSLEEKVVDLLIEKNYHISFAESCTAGLCSARLVNVSNASKVFNASFTTYANAAKVKYLGVDNNTIEKYGVVSEEVAYEMARGVAAETESEVGVGVTGIAGPTGATENKPVGMVCFGFSVNNEVKTFTKYFGNIGRQSVRSAVCDFVFKTLSELLNNS